MHSKLLKQRNYKVDKERPISKEHFEVNKPKDFSDLVAKNLSKDNSSDEEQGLFHLNGISRLHEFENIQEANEESSSSPDGHQSKSKMESIMNRFHDPKSSTSSDNYRRGLNAHTSSYESGSQKSINPNNQSSENLLHNLTQKEP